MSQVNFYLKTDKENKQGLSPVVAQLTFSGERLSFPTGVRVRAKSWNASKQRVRVSGPEVFDQDYNLALDRLEQKAKNIFNEALVKGVLLTKDYVRSKWNQEGVRNRNDFFKAFEDFVAIHKPVKAVRTTLSYNTTINFLKAFEKVRKTKITFDGLNHEMFERIRNYAFEDKGYKNNYLATCINRLKTFVSWATDRGLNFNLSYKKFSVPEVEKTIVCLYEGELFRLYNHEFKNKKLDRARDVYCFGCFTGLRYSDLRDLKREHIREDEIQKTIVKTRQFLRIPLNRFAREILEKYDASPYGPLPRISSQKFNDYIKDACKAAGINSLVTVTNYSGGKLIEETRPKYELITSHTARKTFATNSLIFGMSETSVKRITGHKKDQSFQRYVNFADHFLKEQLNTVWNDR